MKSTGWKQEQEEETVPLNDSGGDGGGRNRRSNSISFAPTVTTTSADVYDYGSDDDDDDDDDEGDEYFLKVDDEPNSFDAIRDKEARKEMRRADRLSVRLLAIDDDDEETESAILVDALGLDDDEQIMPTASDSASASQLYKRRPRGGSVGSLSSSNLQLLPLQKQQHSGSILGLSLRNTARFRNMFDFYVEEAQKNAARKICTMISVALAFLIISLIGIYIGMVQGIVGPPNQPVGPYTLVERQEGLDFFQYYTFYVGRDSVGSNGYNMYVDRKSAEDAGICNVTWEDDVLDVAAIALDRPRHERQRKLQDVEEEEQEQTSSSSTTAKYTTAEQVDNEKKNADKVSSPRISNNSNNNNDNKTSSGSAEPFVYLGSSPTVTGPRDSIRLEGIRRFNRGLFIIDVRHVPAGCGVWPAFWLTDEANWPVNGEIDIVEGVNYQDMAKTAMHSTKGCVMDDIPLGTMTGTWDSAQGIPDKKTGIPDMTLRYAQNCFVYDPHQWLNQGCVAVDNQGGTLGIPLNEKGGGVYALEWDPVNRHVRSWVFTPHSDVPDNLVQAIRTAHLTNEADRVMPDPDLWPIPYGYFAIGQGTNCPASHFKQMRLVLNTAFCGSVAGNRYFMDCPKQFKSFKTCNEYVKSNPDELKEAYWKIRGVYVYQREWERTWIT